MPRIVYLSWPAAEISGGIKVAFQHAQLLAASGQQAVVATADGMRPVWFQSGAQLIKLDEVRTDDVLVFPENNADLLEQFAASPQPKVLFCQNPFFVYRGLARRRTFEEYGIRHVLCPSHTVMDYCRRRLPGLKAGYTPFYIDAELFNCPPHKKLQIACLPRKRPLEMGVIRDLFLFESPQFASVQWVVIENATEGLVARTMRDSAVFLSLARFEAHSMTTLEAMASGCVVAGFIGSVGGNDCATTRNGFWAAEDDALGCASQLAKAVQVASGQGAAWRAMVEGGMFTAQAWRREESARLLSTYWRETLHDFAT
jgi:hypothetical protein